MPLRPKVEPRDISPLLAKLREYLLGRKTTNYLRFDGAIAARTQPPPDLPDGPAHKLSDNYYYTRDGRREMQPPLLLAGGAKLLAAKAGETQAPQRKHRTPGNVFLWDAPADK